MKLLNLRCAFYGRRSTDEHQMASMEVQTQEGQRFIVAQGGTLAPEHVYLDDAISRAEFKKRPGLIALLNAANAGEFDAVVVRDESRLGGDTFRSGLVIQDLLESGIRLFYYYTDEEVTLDGAVDKFMIAARSFAAELEREKTAQRTHEHLLTKARRGLVVGGRVYGYDNVEVKEGERRIRVEYRVNEAQAAVVREIFQRYAEGEGLRTLVKDLNERRVPPPRAGRRGTGSWSPSSIHEMIRRERYRGVLVWGKQEKTYKGGTKVRVPRAADEWVKTEAPELRIIDDELWSAVQARHEGRKRITGRTTYGPRVRYLLSGMGRCAVCGGPMRSDNGKVGYENVRVYNCGWHRDRGSTVCGNGLRRPIAAVDAAVMRFIRENLLREDVILDALQELRRRLCERAKAADTEAPELEQEVRKVRAEIERLSEAIMSTTDPPATLVRMLKEREKRLSALEGKLTAIRTAPSVLDLEIGRMEREARKRIEHLDAVMQRNPLEARKALETLVTGPLLFTPIETSAGKRYRIEGELALEALFVIETTSSGGVPSASPAGFETLRHPQNAAIPLDLPRVASARMGFAA
ncbi:recombinase family protein [Polyangium sp. y55x31]|uniref:recombinase family protein n=1 Tax=Polyangium sp. y55x31 TaxID=3042688 RepID=UPI0024832C75|nr:recombinase family protein [Polyangium sp. y55x31]MDI1484712.1 recombinase family protein [Polyangium sp. y55x31]